MLSLVCIFYVFYIKTQFIIILLDAFRLIKKIKEEPSKSSKLKRDHFAHIGVNEVFLEATPSAFVFMIFILTSNSNGSEYNDLKLLLLGPGDGTFRSNVQVVLFIVSCGSSIFSSAFGVTR